MTVIHQTMKAEIYIQYYH